MATALPPSVPVPPFEADKVDSALLMATVIVARNATCIGAMQQRRCRASRKPSGITSGSAQTKRARDL